MLVLEIHCQNSGNSLFAPSTSVAINKALEYFLLKCTTSIPKLGHILIPKFSIHPLNAQKMHRILPSDVVNN